MVTIYDIAKKANVSPMTVSRVLNNANNIRDETRKKVEDAIKELNYIPNNSARTLVSKKSKIITLIITDVTNPFFTIVARGAEDKALQSGYQLILCNTDENNEKESKYLDMLLSTGSAGALIAPANDDSTKKIKSLLKHNFPIVLMDRTIKNNTVFDEVVSDNETSSRKLLEHLIENGHRKIAIINAPLNISTARERQEGYFHTLKLHGIEINENYLFESNFQFGDVSDIISKILKMPSKERPTAIFATNNFLGLSTIKALQKNNVKIPDEMAIISYDDIPRYTEDEPFLSVASQPAYNFGYFGIQLLIERIEGYAPKEPRKIVLPSEIRIRASSGKKT